MNAHLIDDVARRMTDVAPPAGLRDRVVARLADRPAPWRPWLSVVAAAAIIAVVAGVTVARRTPQRSTSLPLAPASPAVASNTTSAPLVSATITATRVSKKRAAKSEVISAAETAWRARAIPAIAAAPALVATDIQPETLSLSLLELKPLVTEPVIVAPIGADASGGR